MAEDVAIIEEAEEQPKKVLNKRYEIEPLDRWNIVTDKKYRMNSLLKFQLDILINAVQYDFDGVMMVDGDIEGSGKSVLAQQVAYYCAWKSGTKFGVGDIVFTPQQFLDAVEKAGKRQVILWDEAYQGSSKWRQMSKINQVIMSTLQKIRQKNLFIIIVLPYFFDLNSYLAVPRSWYLIHVELKSQMDVFRAEELDFSKPVFIRGFFQFYSRARKKQLFFEGRQKYDYDAVRGNFIGNFPLAYTVDEEEYRTKKAQFATEEQKEERMSEADWIKEALLRGMPPARIKEFVSCSLPNIIYHRNKLEERGLSATDQD
jgi:hypothetical protein